MTFDEMLAEFRKEWPGLWVEPFEVRRQFGRSLKKDTFENIMAGVKNYADSRLIADGFKTHPAKWLYRGRWLDEYEEAPCVMSYHEQQKLLDEAGERVRAKLRAVK